MEHYTGQELPVDVDAEDGVAQEIDVDMNIAEGSGDEDMFEEDGADEDGYVEEDGDTEDD